MSEYYWKEWKLIKHLYKIIQHYKQKQDIYTH